MVKPSQTLTHKAVDTNTLTIVDTGDGCNNVVDEDLWKSFSYHSFLQSLIHQGEKTVTTHSVNEPLHTGEGVAVLLVLVDPVNDGISVIIKTEQSKE